MAKSEATERCLQSLRSVDLESQRLQDVCRMSCRGGMKQRVCIAISILLKPKVIICDEPTSALDVVTQRQVMETIDRVQKRDRRRGHLDRPRHGLDGPVCRQGGGDVCRAANGAKHGPRRCSPIPKHPYAKALINSLPNLENKGVFQGIPGLAPSLLRLPGGCAFHPRCQFAMEVCRTNVPPAPNA